MTSITKNYDIAMRDIVRAYMNASLPTGATYPHGIATGAVGYSDCNEACDMWDSKLRSEVDAWIAKIRSGSVNIGIDHKTGASKLASDGECLPG